MTKHKHMAPHPLKTHGHEGNHALAGSAKLGGKMPGVSMDQHGDHHKTHAAHHAEHHMPAHQRVGHHDDE